MNAANSAAAPKAPVLSPGLSSTHSERSCVSMEDGPRLELTDAFEELQAFFGGGPPDGGVPSAPIKVRVTAFCRFGFPGKGQVWDLQSSTAHSQTEFRANPGGEGVVHAVVV